MEPREWKTLNGKLVHMNIEDIDIIKKEGYVTQDDKQAYEVRITAYLCEKGEYVNLTF